MKQVVLTPSAAAQARKLSRDVWDRIKRKLEGYAAGRSADVTIMKGQNAFRLRVGDWRAIFVENSDTITVLAVGHRREIYD